MKLLLQQKALIALAYIAASSTQAAFLFGNVRDSRNYRSYSSSSSSLVQMASNGNEDGDGDLLYSSPVTSFLGKFLPKTDGSAKDLDKTKVRKMSIDKMVATLDQGLREREWFVTGNVMPELFADDFFFKDPDVQLEGIDKYADGVRRLFDQETSRAEIIECSLNEDLTEGNDDGSQVITVEWRLSGNVNIGPVQGLKIKPYICYSDLYVRNEDGLIYYQEDRFDIPGWDILLSAIFPWLGPPIVAAEAPPIEEIIRNR